MDNNTFLNLVDTHTDSIKLAYGMLTNAQFDKIIRRLEYNSLQKLELWCLEIASSKIEKLVEALIHNSSLRKLDLWNNKIGDDGAQKLAEALQHNSYLQTLDLTNNGIGDMGAEKLAEALQHNSSLQTLVLDNNIIGDMGAQKLAGVLKHNHSLQTLDLRHNKLSNIPRDIMIETLNMNPFITIYYYDEEIKKLCSEEGKHIRMQQYTRFKHTKSSKN